MSASDNETRSTPIEDAAASAPRVRPRQTIGRAAVLLMAGNLVGSVLGFVRQAVIAGVYGTHVRTDAFFAASIVPQMFYDLTVGAAVSAALIPTFTETLEREGRGALWDVVGNVLALAAVVLGLVTLVLFALARPLVLLVGRGQCGATTGLIGTTTDLLRVLIPTLLFLGLSAVALSALYSLRQFAVPAFAPSLYHIGIIVGALALSRPLGITALPIGAVAGAGAQAGVQVLALYRSGGRLHLRLALTPAVRRIVRLYLPVAVGLIVSVLGQIIDLSFKLQLPCGSLSAMQFATALTQFPIGIAVAAMSFAILPSISSDAAFDRLEEFKSTLAMGIRFVLFLTLPAAAGFIVLGTPIVALIFQHHHFTSSATAHTALALAGYAIQIPFVGVDQLLIVAFYARKNTVTPMLVGVVGVGIYLVSAMLLLPRLHILGLALANTLQNSLHAVILLALLVSTLGAFGGRALVRSVAVSLAATGLMTVSALSALLATHAALGQGSAASRVASAVVPIILAAAVYVAVQVLLRSEEVNLVVVTVRRKMLGRPA